MFVVRRLEVAEYGGSSGGPSGTLAPLMIRVQFGETFHLGSLEARAPTAVASLATHPELPCHCQAVLFKSGAGAKYSGKGGTPPKRLSKSSS